VITIPLTLDPSLLRGFRKTVDDLAADSQQCITALETQTHPLFDNGQPGRCNRMEARVVALEHWRIYAAGGSATVAAIVAIAIKFLL
jgi:hypothetical protein